MAKPSPTENLGRRISAIRMKQGISQARVSHWAGVHPSYLSRIETGKVHPTVRTAVRIAGALKVPLDDLLGPSPSERKNRPCPVSSSGRCLLDLIDTQTRSRNSFKAESITPEQVRVLKKVLHLTRRNHQSLLKALDNLLDEFIRSNNGA